MSKRKVKRKLSVKKLLVFVVILLLVVVGIGSGVVHLYNNNDNASEKKVSSNKKYTFIEFGSVVKEADIYEKNNNKYNKVGTIQKNVNLEFLELDDSYLKINGFDKEYYIDIENVLEIDSIESNDDRYKNYILFNKNVVTNDKTSFYDEDGILLYTINYSYDLPIIINDDDRYGVEYNDCLLFISKDDVKEVKSNSNTDKSNSSGVGVLNYHFFYDEDNSDEKAECNQEICESKTQFQSELDYLRENNIFTVTTKELEWYIDGKVNLPKSVLITIDDGYMMELGIKMLEENKMNGCVFLITSWFDNINFKNSYEYVEFNSHGEKLHNTGVCPGGQGGGIKCLPKETLLADLKTSSDKLGGSTVIAYPFYEYNDYSIEVLKEAGYTMAFAGESTNSDNLVHVGSNKYELPRFVMVNYTTKGDLDKYFSNIK